MTNKKKDKGESRALESRRSTAVSSYVKKEPQFPLAAFLFPFRHETSAWKAMPIILMVALLFRAGVGFYWGYSGATSGEDRFAINMRLTTDDVQATSRR